MSTPQPMTEAEGMRRIVARFFEEVVNDQNLDLRVPGMPCVWSESLKRTEVAPNRIAEGKGARREAGSEGSRRRTTALTNRNRIEGP